MALESWRASPGGALSLPLSPALLACSEPSTGGDSSTAAPTSSGSAHTTGTTGAMFGEPLVVAVLEEWVRVELPEMRCGDGPSAGVMAHFTEQSRDLRLYFPGGGASLTSAVQSQALGPWEPEFLTSQLAGDPSWSRVRP